ncbi:hypothetical protein HPC49_25715 [Pyxidicoccus fallax]|uniref:Beta-ketoacyl synthase n=1 Tax=Pyxidicoccus fallax TaxID=394095 RepID=A0A848LTR2_9BACT|nr:hypothetical protein [Pyxidicoccus fallax]NMO20774.1 hypothetical protein [Pyxidicoccus fallax]NPC81605.1 hypothetical protein [Pyxidicoccus fallax]
MRSRLAQQPAAGDMVVTALGMISSLGHGVIPSCAAARAGINRWSDLDVDAMDDAEVNAVPLQGHAIQGLTEGFAGLGRFLRLADAAFADLLHYGALSPTDFDRTQFLLHLPDDTYEDAWSKRYEPSVSFGGTGAQARDRERARQASHQEHFARRLMDRLLSLHGISAQPRACSLSFGGPAAFVKALLHCERLLNARMVERCVLGGIDSYVSGDTLGMIHQLGLIQHGANPDGFFPGEAAAFIAIERFDTARARGARVEARIGAAAIAREEHSRFSGHPTLGAGLFQAAASAYERLGTPPPEIPLVITNLNGSSHRANDVGNALVRLKAAELPADFKSWSPAESFGELGAATGPVATCMGVRAFVRSYARSSHILVWLASDGQDRGAFFLTRGWSSEKNERGAGALI